MIGDEILLRIDFVVEVGGEEGAGGSGMGKGVVRRLIFFVEEVHVVHEGDINLNTDMNKML